MCSQQNQKILEKKADPGAHGKKVSYVTDNTAEFGGCERGGVFLAVTVEECVSNLGERDP
jgi:hypothetical protein